MKWLRRLKWGDGLIIGGVVLVSLPLLWSACLNILQSRERAAWEREFRNEARLASRLDAAGDPTGSLRGGASVWTPTRIIIEKIGLDAVVVQGRHLRDLSRGPMHIPSTAGPGEGNCAIAAHKEKWFRNLATLRRADRVILMTPNAQYVYEVIGQHTLTKYDVGVLDETLSPTLTLITCTGAPYSRSDSRLIVTARKVTDNERDKIDPVKRKGR